MKGKIARVVEGKKFGFIRSDLGIDYFFHETGYNGHWDDLVADMKDKSIEVEFEETNGVKGPRAENVRRVDSGVFER